MRHDENIIVKDVEFDRPFAHCRIVIACHGLGQFGPEVRIEDEDLPARRDCSMAHLPTSKDSFNKQGLILSVGLLIAVMTGTPP